MVVNKDSISRCFICFIINYSVCAITIEKLYLVSAFEYDILANDCGNKTTFCSSNTRIIFNFYIQPACFYQCNFSRRKFSRRTNNPCNTLTFDIVKRNIESISVIVINNIFNSLDLSFSKNFDIPINIFIYRLSIYSRTVECDNSSSIIHNRIPIISNL